MSNSNQYRLVTRSDFDGLVSAVVLKELNLISEIKFVHPKDVQDGKVDITETDILTDLPYDPRCFMCFDHHDSEGERIGDDVPKNFILDKNAKSAARIVYDFFGGKSRLPNINEELLESVDKADAGEFDRNEILQPNGWVLLSFLMDPRTGLGRFRNFRISNFELMLNLIDYCRSHTIDEILDLPDVRERAELFEHHTGKAIEQIRRCTTVIGKVAVLDLRDEELIHPTNRFLIYALFPECNISIHVMNGTNNENTVFAIGKSILDRSNKTNIGELALEYGGGGHNAAGTCRVDNATSEQALSDIVDKIMDNENAGRQKQLTH